MILDRVTVTGADDSVKPDDLVELSRKFPFVEWGILLSRRQEGNARFPTFAWMKDLQFVAKLHHLNLSGHLCGGWVRDLCQGKDSFCTERQPLSDMFQRVQLNFHAEGHELRSGPFVDALKKWGREQYIFQFDDVNNMLMVTAKAAGINAVPLFDLSGGAGVEPDHWPEPIGMYCGYAGGLHPLKLADQITQIQKIVDLGRLAESRIWIDVETHVRSDQDKKFDLEKVEKFLETAKPFVTPTQRTT